MIGGIVTISAKIYQYFNRLSASVFLHYFRINSRLHDCFNGITSKLVSSDKRADIYIRCLVQGVRNSDSECIGEVEFQQLFKIIKIVVS